MVRNPPRIPHWATPQKNPCCDLVPKTFDILEIFARTAFFLWLDGEHCCSGNWLEPAYCQYTGESHVSSECNWCLVCRCGVSWPCDCRRGQYRSFYTVWTSFLKNGLTKMKWLQLTSSHMETHEFIESTKVSAFQSHPSYAISILRRTCSMEKYWNRTG